MKNSNRDTADITRQIEARLGFLRVRQPDPFLSADELFLEIVQNVGAEFVTAVERRRRGTATTLGVQLIAELLYYLERHAPKIAA